MDDPTPEQAVEVLLHGIRSGKMRTVFCVAVGEEDGEFYFSSTFKNPSDKDFVNDKLRIIGLAEHLKHHVLMTIGTKDPERGPKGVE